MKKSDTSSPHAQFFTLPTAISATTARPAHLQSSTLPEILRAPCACYFAQGAHISTLPVSIHPLPSTTRRSVQGGRHHHRQMRLCALRPTRAARPHTGTKKLGERNQIPISESSLFTKLTLFFCSEKYRDRVVATKPCLFPYCIFRLSFKSQYNYV